MNKQNKIIPCVDCICLSTCRAVLDNETDSRSKYFLILDEMCKKCSLLFNFIWVDERTQYGKLSYIPDNIHWLMRFMSAKDKEAMRKVSNEEGNKRSESP